MEISVILAFWAVSILFVITPGADWAYAMAAGVQSRPAPAVLGLLAGHLTATLIVAAGAGALLASAPGALAILTVLGSGYLAWLGLSMLRRPPVPRADAGADTRSWARWTAEGFGVSGLNPKVFLLFLALLPQFAHPGARWPLSLQMIVLGLIHVASCAVVYLAVAYGARTVLTARPKAARIVGRASGALMLLLALVLLGEQAMR